MGNQSTGTSELNPLESCINALRTDIGKYIQENKIREDRKITKDYTWSKLTHDSALAAKKMKLAKDMDYTLGQIHQDYKTELKGISGYQDKHRTELAYHLFCRSFARIADCLDTGVAQEKSTHTSRARAGKLAAALQSSLKTWALCWDQAKEKFWTAETLQGRMFVFSEVNKVPTFKKFDSDMSRNRRCFTAIMTQPEPELDDGVGVAAPAQDPPPAYNQDAAPAADPFVTVTVGGKTVKFSNA